MAFNEMKRRVERANEQRTAMLSGVSHDLKTILTRFRLSLAMIEATPETQDLEKDVEEMQAMLEGYLAFARGDSGEAATPTDISAMLEEMRLDAERHGAPVALHARGNLNVTVRPMAIRRCLGNLVGNAQRYGRRVEIFAAREGRFVVVQVDDDGPGIPVASRRGRVPAVLPARRGAQHGRERLRPRPLDSARHRPLARRRRAAWRQPVRGVEG